MKLLVVAHDSNISGGANRSLLTTLLLLRDRHGVEAEVLVPRGRGVLNRALSDAEIPWRSYPYLGVMSSIRHDGKDILRYLKAYLGYPWEWILSRLVAARLRNRGYDLVYTNTRLTAIGALAARRMGVPHVYHVREFGAEEPIWGFWGYQEIVEHSTRVILISQALYDRFAEHAPTDGLVMIHNGIDSPLGLPGPTAGRTGLHLLITGRLMPDKGHRDALLALRLLLDEGFRDITLHIAGSPPKRSHMEWFGDKLREQVETLHLEDNVVFHGEVDDMPALRREMDIELICAIRETFGRVTVEGMRSKLLVIGADTGGTPEIIQDGVTGLLYRQGNPVDLQEKLRAAYQDPALRARLAEAGYRYAQERFTPEGNASAVHQVLLQAAGDGAVTSL